MAEYLQKILGGIKSSAAPAASVDVDADFADFAATASPAAAASAASQVYANTDASSTPLSRVHLTTEGRPYTRWYRVWERVTIADFYQELFIIPVILLIVAVNLWGSAANRSRANAWATAHFPLLESEFAQVGIAKNRSTGESRTAKDILKEKTKAEYITYCTGRKNVACLDVKISLIARYNPFSWLGDLLLSFFVDSWPAPTERVEATALCFDGKEKLLLPAQAEKAGGSSNGSVFDGFVFAVVHKDQMKKLRDDRYDLSLTTTKDHAKLPGWATVMSESAEVTEAVLTPELIKAISDVGDDFESLIISDMPIDAPKKLTELVPKKRVYLSTKLGTSPALPALFAVFLRIPDHLVSSAHFRPEAIRRIKATREEEARKLRKVDEDEKAEERKLASDKLKREERERKLSKMSDVEQKKFLEKEREKNMKKSQKKQTMRG